MQKFNKKTILKFGILIIASLLIEIFVCNFRHFESLRYSEIEDYTIQYDDGIQVNDDGSITVLEEGTRRIELLNINQKVHNIRLDIEKAFTDKEFEKRLAVVTVQLFMTDQGNTIYYGMPPRNVIHKVEDTHYIKLNLSGESEKLAIDLSAHPGSVLYIHDIALNVVKPFAFSMVRWIGILATMLLICGCVQMKKLAAVVYDTKCVWQNVVLVALVGVTIGIWTFFAGTNLYFTESWNTNHYYNLTEALAAGQAEMLFGPSEALMNMENPYDYGERLREGVEFYWDFTYYEGSYYVYFGVVPVVLIYLPFFLIMGYHIMNYKVIILGMVLLAIGWLLLLRKIVNKYFKNTSYVLFLMLYFLSINAVGCAMMAHHPDLYSVPIVIGLQFTVWGWYAWLCARERAGWKRYLLLFAGAFCMALVAGCRPQLLLGSFMIFPLLVVDWYRKWKEKDYSFVKDIGVIAVPYLVVAAGLMYYNYIRFDSPFDFGANYNLTTNDMTVRGFRLDRIATGIFAYLLQLPRFKCSFPYLEDTYIDSGYQGITIKEAMFGGVLATNLLLLVGIAVMFRRNFYAQKRIYAVHVMSVLSALIIVVMDTQMAGILYRYTMDFMIFLYIPAIMAIFCLDNKLKDNVCYVWLMRGVWACFMWGMLYYGLFYVVQDADNMEYMNPELYYRIASKIQFWL